MISKFKNYINSDKRIFAEGMSFAKMYLIFIIGSFIGVIYEEIVGFVKYYHIHKVWFWPNRQGVIYGPFNPLYGVGIVLIILILNRKKRKPIKTFIYGALLGGAIEFIVSYLMELVLGAASWDYSNRPLNIMGRTTILYMIFWGIATVILIHYIYPFLSKLIEKIPRKIGNILVVFLVIFMTLNMIISWTALGRQVLRHKGYEPFTFIGEFYDKVYTDEYLKKVYTNMKFVK
ncbi:MAG: putative ABC transporter permease [Ruminococcus sp.]|nr:putative ABC transporter permease [Ruminococcus sp.]